MLEKQQQSETCIMINDTPQRAVASLFRCIETFDRYFITNLLLSLF